MASLKRALAILARRPGLLAAVVLVSLIASLTEGLGLGLVLGLLPGGTLAEPMRAALGPLAILPDDYASGDAIGRIRVAAIILFLAMLVRGVFYYASRALITWMQVSVVHDLRSRVFHQMLSLEASHVHDQTGGSLFATLISHTDNAGLMMRDAAKSITDLFTIAVYVTVLLVISWPMTLVTMALLAILTIGIRWGFSQGLTRLGERAARAREALESDALEGLAGLELIHLYDRQHDAERRFRAVSRAYARALMRQSLLINLSRPAFVTANGVGLTLLILVGTTLRPDLVDAWVGYVVLLIAVAFRLMSPAAALSEAQNVVQTLAPSLDEVQRFLQRTDRADRRSGTVAFRGLKDGIRLDQVGFRYEVGAADVLHDVSFTIPRGQVVALLGASGQGKTTIVKILARLYDATSGTVLVDGADLRAFDLSSWRKKLAVVSQDTFLFHDSLMANLRFVRPDASSDEVRAVAAEAGADTFIAGLPGGYETVVGPRGARLSGGQRQLIALTRALLIEPDVLVLDEATSQLDAHSDACVQDAIERLRHRCAILVVAHRLSTIRDADHVVVLSEGRVVEQGAPRELLARGGAYATLVGLQQATPSAPSTTES